MLDIIQNRIKVLQQQLEQVQQNISSYSKMLEREKNLQTQLIGHHNEAHHLMTEAQKIKDSENEENPDLEEYEIDENKE